MGYRANLMILEITEMKPQRGGAAMRKYAQLRSVKPGTLRTFEDLEAWRSARELTNLTYGIFRRLPASRDFGLRDQGQRITREAAMAKMTATENAQRIIDMAVQMHGGMGVRKGHIVESLYREIRALRIYEGATEVQQLIIGKDVLNA